MHFGNHVNQRSPQNDDEMILFRVATVQQQELALFFLPNRHGLNV
jgi:hypothetical protein